MADLLSENSEKIEQLKFHKNRWAVFGLIFILYMSFVLASWIGDIPVSPLFWLLSGITMTLITIIWWVWTFSLVNDIIQNRINEIAILDTIIQDLKSVKSDVKSLKKQW